MQYEYALTGVMMTIKQRIRLEKYTLFADLAGISVFTKDGFCNGDAFLWAYAAIHGRGQEYIKDCEFIAALTPDQIKRCVVGHEQYIAHVKMDEIPESLKVQHKIYLRIFTTLEKILFFFNPNVVDPSLGQLDYDMAANIALGAIHHAPDGTLEIDETLHIEKEFSYSGIFTSEELTEILKKCIPTNKIIMISSSNHTTSCVYDGINYQLFDPNEGVSNFQNTNGLSNKIAIAMEEERDANIPIALSVFDYAKNKKGRYPSYAELIEMSSINAPSKDGNTSLMRATRTKNLQLVQDLLTHGAEINKQDKNNNTALHLAFTYGAFAIAKELIARGADLRLENNRKLNAFLYAAVSNKEIFFTMLEKDPTLVETLYSVNGSNLYHFAGQSDFGGYIFDYLENHLPMKDFANTKNTEGRTPLEWASRFGNIANIDYLLANKADINARNSVGQTALMSAAAMGQLEAVKHLLDAGADPETLDIVLVTHPDVLNFFINEKKLLDSADKNAEPSQNFLVAAIRANNVALIKLLIKNNWPVDLKDKKNNNLLHYAIREGLDEMIPRLLDLGVDPYEENNKGRNAYELAWRRMHGVNANKYQKICKILEERGLDKPWEEPKTRLAPLLYQENEQPFQDFLDQSKEDYLNDLKGRSNYELHSSIARKDAKLFMSLLNNNADVNRKDHLNNTPLHIATRYNAVGIAKKLIEKGADFNIEGFKKCTAIMYAAMYSKDIFFILLKKDPKLVETIYPLNGSNLYHFAGQSNFGVDIFDYLKTHLPMDDFANVKNAQGKTPLHWASAVGNIANIDYLLANKADINIRDNDGQTPLMSAIAAGKVEAVKHLLDSGAESLNAYEMALNNFKNVSDYDRKYASLKIVEIFKKRGLDKPKAKPKSTRVPPLQFQEKKEESSLSVVEQGYNKPKKSSPLK